MCTCVCSFWEAVQSSPVTLVQSSLHLAPVREFCLALCEFLTTGAKFATKGTSTVQSWKSTGQFWQPEIGPNKITENEEIMTMDKEQADKCSNNTMATL